MSIADTNGIFPAQITHPWQGHLMEPAFQGFVSFASQRLLDQYIAEVGQPNLGVTPIDRMIDRATGNDIRELQRFIDWCVVQFGTPEQIGASK